MSKRVIIGLAIFMGLVLLGLIFVQFKWVKLAFKANEEQFDQIVRRALTDAARSLEKQATYNSMMKDLYYFTNDTNILLNDLDSSTISEIRKNQQNPEFQAQLSFHSNIDGKIVDTNISISFKTNVGEGKNSRRIVLNEDYYSTPDLRRDFYRQVLRSSLYSSGNVEKNLNNQMLVEFIEGSLGNYGVDLDFEFAVTNMNSLTSFTSGSFNPESHERIYRVKLFQDDFFESKNYLTVYFPKRKQYIYNQLGVIGAISIIIIFVIIMTFSFTLFIIFRQKKFSEMKNDFVNNMTHELKTPISTISLASQMLGDTTIPPETKNIDRISSIITQESKRLGYQVEKVLQSAVFSQGRMNLKNNKVDFHDIIETSIENFTIQVESKGGLLIPSLHAEQSEVTIDRVHMTNVLSNLLDNALKYCDKTPEIFVETRNIPGKFIFSVRDNGMGISKADQKRIFDRFFRVTTGNLHNIKGFGLGLSYVRKVVEEHKGVVNIDSEMGKGTVFTIELPLENEIENS